MTRVLSVEETNATTGELPGIALERIIIPSIIVILIEVFCFTYITFNFDVFFPFSVLLN